MSRGFRFRLDAALQQRARQEQAVQLALAQRVRAQQAAFADLETLRKEVLREREHPTATSGARLDSDARQSLLYYLDRAEGRLQQQGNLVQHREREVAQAQAVLLQAAARRRALERLRERQRQEFQAREQRREDRELDEHATLAFVRPIEQGEADARIRRH